MVDLQGGVLDAVPAVQQPLRPLNWSCRVAVGAGCDQHVRRQGGIARGDLPDVQVVYALVAAGCDPIFSEKISARVKVRPEFAKAMEFARTIKTPSPTSG